MTDETHYAFPHKFQSGPNETTICFGMSLRDYFAAKAMEAIMTRSSGTPFPSVANYAYAQADAMLKAREQ
jgi:hypothetical protein